MAAPVVERVQKLRAAQLASVGTKGKDAWPGRCTDHANALFAASGDIPLRQRTMKERLGCHDKRELRPSGGRLVRADGDGALGCRAGGEAQTSPCYGIAGGYRIGS